MTEAALLEEVERPEAEVVVSGRTAPTLSGDRPCEHSIGLMQRVEVGLIHETLDPTSPMVAWQVKLRLQCSECGIRFRFVGPSEERDFGLAVVLNVVPSDHPCQ